MADDDDDLAVERSIHFYRIDVGTKDDGDPIVFDYKAALEAVGALDAKAGEAYLDLSDQEQLLALVDKGHQMRLCKVRRGALPQKESQGILRDLKLAQGEGLAEPIHLVFWDRNIIGADFNFYGPRASTAATYLALKAAGRCPRDAKIRPLLKQDMQNKIDDIEGVTLFSLQLDPSYAEKIKERDQDLLSAYESMKKIGDPESVEIVLRYRRKTPSTSILERIKGFLGLEDLRENAKKFKVKGVMKSSGRVNSVDLLSDRLISRKSVLRQGRNNKVLNAKSVYAAIEEAYFELKEELEAAAALG